MTRASTIVMVPVTESPEKLEAAYSWPDTAIIGYRVVPGRMIWEFLLYVHHGLLLNKCIHRLLSSKNIHLKTALTVAMVLGNDGFEAFPALQGVSLIRL